MAVKFYIKINDGTEFEVFPNKYEPFEKPMEDGERFYRYKWGNIEFENRPFLYSQTSKPGYLIYTILSAIKETDKIWIRILHEYSEIEVKGYCGIVDGEYENDKVNKVVTLSPIVIDKYTPLLENWETKVDVLNGGDKNKIVNGDFESWDNSAIPIGWENGGLYDVQCERHYINGDYVCKYNDLFGASYTKLQQPVFANKGSNVDLSFYYAPFVVPESATTSTHSRSIEIKLVGTEGTKYLKDDNLANSENVCKWVDPSETNSFIYANNVISMTESEITSMLYYKIFSEPLPFSGTVTIAFIGRDVIAMGTSALYLDKVNLKVNTTPYKTINVEFLNSYLQSYSAFTDVNPLALGVPNNKWNGAWVGDHALDGYFELTTGAPSGRFLSDGTYAPVDADNLRLGDYENNIFIDPNSKYYKCQISEVTIFHCGTYNTTFSYKHRMRAIAVFSRDEAKIKDVFYTQEDVDNDICNQDELGKEIPPARNVGWTKTPKIEKGLRLWVRKPFNDEDDTLGWSLGDQINGGKFQGYDTEHRRTTKRIYPVDTTKSKTLNTCVDLRDTIKILFNQTHPDYATKNVISTFFWNDLETEFQSLQGNNSGNNYVSNKANFLNNIAVLHTLDLKRESNETQQQEGTFKISLKDFLDDLKKYIKVYKYGQLCWWLTDNLDLRIEHIAYFDQFKDINGNVLNYTTQPLIQEDYHDKYKYESDQMYHKVIFDQINSGYPDFTSNIIEFDKIASSKRFKNEENVLKNKTFILTTDLRYCIENANNLDEGLILINYNQVGDQFVAAYGDTQIQGVQILNGNLSLSTILRNFATREGTFVTGKINGEDALFRYTTYTKLGEEITIKGIVWNQYFDTMIEEKTGLVKTLTHDFENGITKVTLIYRKKSKLLVNADTNTFLNLGY